MHFVSRRFELSLAIVQARYMQAGAFGMSQDLLVLSLCGLPPEFDSLSSKASRRIEFTSWVLSQRPSARMLSFLILALWNLGHCIGRLYL